jgi:uncharacterized repeat protein (TIGR03803 family)
MRTRERAFTALLVATALTVVLPAQSAIASYHYKTLYSFQGGKDGMLPYARLLLDDAGNLYGTTVEGGPQGSCSFSGGCGTVFKLAPDGTETVIHAFCSESNCADGSGPYAGLIQDGAGNLYGTTTYGGAHGAGTVFQIAPDGTETVLRSFVDGGIGSFPDGGVIVDNSGTLYGTTGTGGAENAGVVFRLVPGGTFEVLADFPGGAGGASPAGDLAVDKNGNFYGIMGGGAADFGGVFKLRASGHNIKIIYSFHGSPSDAGNPSSGVIMDRAGNIYGTTPQGGTYDRGATYKIAKDGTETVLHSFDRNTAPYGALVRDEAGNLYGTASAGGTSNCGAVFKLMPDGRQIILHAFDGVIDGCNSMAGLVADSRGYLYGTTVARGRYGYGTVFRVKKQ